MIYNRRITDLGAAVVGLIFVVCSFMVLPTSIPIFLILLFCGIGVAVGSLLRVIRKEEKLDAKELYWINIVTKVSGIIFGIGMLFTIFIEKMQIVFLIGIGVIIFFGASLVRSLWKKGRQETKE